MHTRIHTIIKLNKQKQKPHNYIKNTIYIVTINIYVYIIMHFLKNPSLEFFCSTFFISF